MTAISTETLYRKFLKRTGFEEKPFQLTCFKWCWQRETAPSSPAGGILSLEMGLGKTVMILALMESNFKRRTLIVLPCALLDQWEKIIIRTFGYQPLVYHGSRPQNKKLTLEDIMTYPIVLTSYGQVSQPSEKQEDRGRRRSLLCSIQWDRLICDEAHNVSHRTTNDYKGLSEVKAQIIWLVTGTPLQNSRYELATLFILLGLPKPKPSEMTKEIETYMFYLTKAAAGIQLPALEENTTAVAWENRTEKKLSANIHSYLSFCNVSRENRVDAHADAPPAAAPAADDPPAAPPAPAPAMDINAARSLRMKFMTKAKQVCIYPPLLRKKTAFQFTEPDPAEPAETEPAEIAVLTENIFRVDAYASKINAVIETLSTRLYNGCGKIIFCHYTEEIDEIARRLSVYEDISIAKFDGRVPRSKREAMLITPVTVLIAQVKMCREGLNLQEHYSEVYFPSPDFNPAVENQAIARCWRIGQQKPVKVFRFLMNEPTDTAEAVPEMRAVYSMDTYSQLLQMKKRDLIAEVEAISAGG